MKRVVIYFFIWLVAINLFGLAAVNRLNLKPDTAYPWIDPGKAFQTQNWNLLGTHTKWDSFWYLDIVEHGYSSNGPNQLSNIVFFPLYPLLVKILSVILLGNALLSAWLLSSTFLLLALIFLYKLVTEFHPDLNPDVVITALLVFPTAFFFNAIYTESLFLFLSVATFYFAFKKNYLVAGILGALAALTRVTGILLFLPIIIEYLRAHNYRSIKSDIAPLFLIPIATASFFLFHWLTFNDILLFFKVESAWGRNFSINSDHLVLLSNPAIVNFAIDILFVLVAIVSTILVYKKLRPSYAVYMALTLFVALSTGTIMSIGRYILVLFPMFLLIAAIKNEVVQKTWIFVSMLLFALNIMLFVNYYWAG